MPGAFVLAYLYAKGRLPKLHRDAGPDSSSSENESESEDNETSDDMDTSPPISSSTTTTTNRNLARKTSGTSQCAGAKYWQRSNGALPAAKPSRTAHVAAKPIGSNIVEAGQKRSDLGHSGAVTNFQAASLGGKTGAQNPTTTRQHSVGPDAEFHLIQYNRSNQHPKHHESQVLSQPRKYQACAICSSLVPCDDGDTNQHELVYHSEINPPNCTLIFHTYQSLLMKNLRLHGTDLKTCTECRGSFSTPSEMLKHLYTHALLKSTGSMYRCATCATVRSRFTNAGASRYASQAESQVEKNVTQVHEENESDSDLGVRKQTRQLLEKCETSSVASGNDAIVAKESCEPSSVASGNEAIMAIYNEIMSQPVRKQQGERVVCEHCGLLLSKSSLRNHIAAVHAKHRPHKCPLCDKRFTQKGEVKQHLGHHKPFYCKICHKVMINESAYKRHMEVHELNVKPYRCDQCDKGFMRSAYLKVHQVLHTGRKPFQCSLCDQGYMTRKLLDSHMEYHSDVKEFKCTLCPKEYAIKRNLDIHIRTHTRSHLCEQCGKSFTIASLLKKHERSVHSKKGAVGVLTTSMGIVT